MTVFPSVVSIGTNPNFKVKKVPMEYAKKTPLFFVPHLVFLTIRHCSELVDYTTLVRKILF